MTDFTLPATPLPHVDWRAMEETASAAGLVTFYDAVDVPAIPGNAQYLLAYADGAWPTVGPARARFPKATILVVTVTGRVRANGGDCEGGDLSPEAAAGGYVGGMYQWIYSADSNAGPISQGLGGKLFPWWAAEPTGVPHKNPLSIATQFAWPGYGSPGNYDISLADPVALGLGAPPAPVPPPAPHPTPTPPAPPAPATPREASMIDTPTTGGILIAHPDGAVFAEDGAHYYGGMNGHPLNAPIVGIAATPSGHGYWLVGADGGVFNFGDAKLLGPAPRHLAEWKLGQGRGIPIIGIARGAEAGIAYTIIGDTGVAGTAPALYRIPADGSLAA